eukprot:SM000024S07871  [mRNA]  locus=s24:1032077:1033859:- [translate_table: standard]
MLASLLRAALAAHRDLLAWLFSPRVAARRGFCGAVGRTLSHALDLVADLPISSVKYDFARAIAEKILGDNAKQASGLLVVNRTALLQTLARTAKKLEAALRSKQGSSRLGQLVDRYLSWLGVHQNNEVEDKGEKLAAELLWVVKRLADCNGVAEATKLWSCTPGLARMAPAASPRVQRHMVQLSASLCKAVGNGDIGVSGEVCFRLLLLWMPLLCKARHGGDGPILNNSEKQETEEALDRAISFLPMLEQELLYTCWLQEYCMSTSDWPNLSKGFYNWCNKARAYAVTSGGTHSE